MRLRNKKTGEVIDVESLGHAESLKEKYGYQVTLSWATEYENLSQCRTYETLAELNEEWEDYQPKEPLIKDEKIRKFIRDYFEIWGWKIDKGTKIKIEHFDFRTRIYCDTFEIVLPKIDELDICRSYTITELCGEGKE